MGLITKRPEWSPFGRDQETGEHRPAPTAPTDPRRIADRPPTCGRPDHTGPGVGYNVADANHCRSRKHRRTPLPHHQVPEFARSGSSRMRARHEAVTADGCDPRSGSGPLGASRTRNRCRDHLIARVRGFVDKGGTRMLDSELPCSRSHGVRVAPARPLRSVTPPGCPRNGTGHARPSASPCAPRRDHERARSFLGGRIVSPPRPRADLVARGCGTFRDGGTTRRR